MLVVGPGCSGMEIAYDLAEGGARKVRLAVRTPPNILIRSPMGPPSRSRSCACARSGPTAS